MKYILLTLIVIQQTASLKAQTVPYETLDSFSHEINKLQYTANVLSYKDGTTDYEISFPENNFQVTFYNQLALKAVYRKGDGKEVLELTENIDLSKATDADLDFSKEVAIVRLAFPSGILQTKYFKDGAQLNEKPKDFIEFFVKRELRLKNSNKNNSDFTQWVMYNSIVNLCYTLKIEKKLFSKEELNRMQNDFDNLLLNVSYAKISLWEEFISKYPKSLYANLVKKTLLSMQDGQKKREEMEQIKHTKILNFIDSLFNVYKFKPNLTESEFRDYNKEASKAIGYKPRNIPNGYLYISPSKKSEVGPFSFSFKHNLIASYSYFIANASKSKDSGPQLAYTKFLNEVKNQIPAEYIHQHSNSGGTSFRIIYPTIKTIIEVELTLYLKGESSLEIEFIDR